MGERLTQPLLDLLFPEEQESLYQKLLESRSHLDPSYIQTKPLCDYFTLNKQESSNPSKGTLLCPFQEHLVHHTGCTLQFTALSPWRLYTLPWERLPWEPPQICSRASGLKCHSTDRKMVEWGMNVFFGLFCAFVLNVQNTLSETFLLAQVRVAKLCGLDRWQCRSQF